MAARFDFLTSRKTSKTCLALISLKTHSRTHAVIGWMLRPDMSFFVACKFFTFRRPAAEIVIQEYYGAGASLFLVRREDYVPEVDFFEHVLPGDPEPRALYELTQA